MPGWNAAQEGTTPNPAYRGVQAGGAAAEGSAGPADGGRWCEGGELVAVSDLKFSRVIGEVRGAGRAGGAAGRCRSLVRPISKKAVLMCLQYQQQPLISCPGSHAQ